MPGRRMVPFAAACAVWLAGAEAGAATPGVVTGELSRPGYTVVALAPDGATTSVRVQGRRFRVAVPDPLVTLHLRTPEGRYGGPIAVDVPLPDDGASGAVRRRCRRRSCSSRVMGLRLAGRLVFSARAAGSAGLDLGKVVIRDGYAEPTQPLPDAVLDERRTARAKAAVPVGAGNFGYTPGEREERGGVGRDEDRDGVPGAFDVDDNGNRVVDNVDEIEVLETLAGLQVPLESSVNANAGRPTQRAVDRMLVDHLGITFAPCSPRACPRGSRAELDCGGLSWCRRGGTGETLDLRRARFVPFPECCDRDRDGFGEIFPPGPFFFLLPRASSSRIGSGDVVLERLTRGGRQTVTPRTINFVFNSVPAIRRYRDGSGVTRDIAYPVPAKAPGTAANPLVVSSGADGRVALALEFWRAQRRGIAGAGEPRFVDMGNLRYLASLFDVTATLSGDGETNTACRGESLRDESETFRREAPLGIAGLSILRDTAPDRPARPANTLRFTLDVTRCAAGAQIRLERGRLYSFTLNAQVGNQIAGDAASQLVFFRLA